MLLSPFLPALRPLLTEGDTRTSPPATLLWSSLRQPPPRWEASELSAASQQLPFCLFSLFPTPPFPWELGAGIHGGRKAEQSREAEALSRE